ncbi:HIT domain-containing protein [Streptomyces sp. NPDC026294]|uniref:HIT family protein n=1 Tax=Streptomyces sp. NPDC026294 TaxID=3155362 RepID=UPI0033ED97A9
MPKCSMNCAFCRIVAGAAPAAVVARWDDALAIVPLGPVVPGHVLVIPAVHVADATENPVVTGATMTRAAEYAASVGGSLNLITSKGSEATQTVFHLHIHVVPRAAGDALPLPWTPQQTAARPSARLHTVTSEEE